MTPKEFKDILRDQKKNNDMTDEDIINVLCQMFTDGSIATAEQLNGLLALVGKGYSLGDEFLSMSHEEQIKHINDKK